MKSKAFILIFNYISLIAMSFLYGYLDNELDLSVIYFVALTFFLICGIKNIKDRTRNELIEIYNKVFSGATVLLAVDGLCRLKNGRPIDDDIGDVIFAIFMLYSAGVYFYYIYWKPYRDFHKKQ